MIEIFNLKDADIFFRDGAIQIFGEGYSLSLDATKREVAEFCGYEVYQIEGGLYMTDVYSGDFLIDEWTPEDWQLIEYLKANKENCVMQIEAEPSVLSTTDVFATNSVLSSKILDTMYNALKHGMKVEITPKQPESNT